MNTHIRKKKGRDKTQQRIYYENQRKILDIFIKTYPGKGLHQKYLLAKTGIKSRRTLRKHLKDLKEKALVTEEKRVWFLTPNRKIVKAWESMINRLTLNLTKYGVNSEKFFLQVAIVFVPRLTEQAIIYDANFISLDIWQEFQDFVQINSKKVMRVQK